MTDPIADMLARIRNATQSRHPRVDMPLSRLKVEIAKILQHEGYIQAFQVIEPKLMMRSVWLASSPEVLEALRIVLLIVTAPVTLS